MTTNPIDEVMASPVYNPDMPTEVTELYKLMVTTEPSDELLAEYRGIIYGYPTVSIYTGVLVNPRACEIDSVGSMIDDICQRLEERWKEIERDGTPRPPRPPLPPGTPGWPDGRPADPGYTPTKPQVDTYEEWKNTYPQVKDDLDLTKDVMDEFRNHTDRMVSNFPSIIGMIQSQIGNLGALGSLLGNPCLQFGDMLGSLLDAGRKIIDQISRALQAVMGVINNVMGMIQNAMNMVMGMISQAMNMLMGELNKLASALMNMLRMGLAQLLSFLPNDPCLKSLIGGMMTAGAGQIMGKLGL